MTSKALIVLDFLLMKTIQDIGELGTVRHLPHSLMRFPDSHFSNCSSLHLWCNQLEWVQSGSNSIFIFLTDCIHHLQSYLLQQIPLKLANWFQIYRQLKGCKNRRNYLPCLAISLRYQCLRVPTHYTWSHHICCFGVATFDYFIYKSMKSRKKTRVAKLLDLL